MWSALKHIVLIIVAIYSSSCTVDCTFQYSYVVNSDSKVVLAQNNVRNSEGFFFVNCGNEGTSPKMDCNVTMRTWGADDSTLPKMSCGFYPGLSKWQWMKKSLPIQLYQLGRERALVIWDEIHEDHTYKKILNVNMTSCTTSSLYFLETFFNTYVIVHEKSFEVITSDPQQCSLSLTMCRLIYNEKGTQLRYITFPAKIQSGKLEYLASESLPQGFIFRYDIYSVIKYINGTGGMVQLDTNVKGITQGTPRASSTAHNKYAICGIFVLNSTTEAGYLKPVIRCDQFRAGDTKPKFHVSLENSERIKVLAVHNLEGDGFLLATLECDSYFHPSCGKFTVSKYEPGGTMVRLDKKYLDLQCSGRLENLKVGAYSVGDKDGDRICFYYSCVREIYDSKKRVNSVLNFYDLC